VPFNEFTGLAKRRDSAKLGRFRTLCALDERPHEPFHPTRGARSARDASAADASRGRGARVSGAVAFVVRDVEKRYGSTTVLEDATVTLHGDQKIGVIGRNGAGKSTLCRLLLQTEEPERGEIHRADGLRVGYLEQHDPFTLEETAQEFLERHTGREGWRCGQFAAKLGLTPANLDTRMGTLPGGYRTRVKLTAMLLGDPDFLVLDEPTNFLDLSTVLLVQDFLADFRGGVLVVSHDREFLKSTCDHTLMVERGGLTLYPGDIEQFFAWQAEQMDVARRTNAAISAQREHLQKFVDRFGAKASKATQAKSKMKQIERLKPIAIANPLATVRIKVPAVEARKGLALAGESISIGYPERVIATDVTVAVDRGAKVAIVGDNGQGKTTLLRTLSGDLEPLAGTVKRSHGVEISYYAQHVYQALHPKDTVRSHLERSAAKDVMRQDVLDMAGALLFKGDDVEKPVSVLSGGERARLCLAGLLLAKKPVLVLDEPTNHLDFETVEALGDALRDFAGTVLFVSHDRTFVNMVATQIVEVDDGKVRVLPGTYADYVEALQIRARQAASGKPAAKDVVPKQPKDPAAAAAAHAERRRRTNERDRAAKSLKDVESRMAKIAAERTAILADIARDPTTRKHDAYARIAVLDHDNASAEAQWLELTAKIESLKD
jgi:ATP-binding cassette subfamily F protein 3